jgi:hypothetical protein
MSSDRAKNLWPDSTGAARALAASLATGSHLVDASGETAHHARSWQRQDPAICFVENFGAQRRNRTADTGIFNPGGPAGSLEESHDFGWGWVAFGRG